MSTTYLPPEAQAVIGGYHADPFRYLGPHQEGGRNIVRAFLPGAEQVIVVDQANHHDELQRIDDGGLFSGEVTSDLSDYRLKTRWHGDFVTIDDAYRFPPVLSDFDLYLLGEGSHLQSYEKLGAHPLTIFGVRGVAFAVFAPNAKRVSVVGDFNFWDGRRHAMRVRGNGFWEIFIPGIEPGQKYKYEILGPDGALLPLKSDPYAFAAELRPSTATVIIDLAKLPSPRPAKSGINGLGAPMSIYEVHLGSWRRKPEEGSRWLTYRELAESLPAYVADMG